MHRGCPLVAGAIVAVVGAVWACGDPYGGEPEADAGTTPTRDGASPTDSAPIEASPVDSGNRKCRVRGLYVVGNDDRVLYQFDPVTTKVTRIGPVECKSLVDAAGTNASASFGAMAIGRDGFARMFATVSTTDAAKRYLIRVSLTTGACNTQVTPISFYLDGLAAVRDPSGDVFYGTAYDEVDAKKGEFLYRIDPNAGTRAAVGAIHTSGVNASVVLLDSADDRLFAIRRIDTLDHEIYELDRATGAITAKTPAKFSGFPFSAVRTPETTWLFIVPVSKPGPAPELWTFDPATKALARSSSDFALSVRTAGVDVACD